MRNYCYLFINWTSYTLIKQYLELIALTVPELKNMEQKNNFVSILK